MADIYIQVDGKHGRARVTPDSPKGIAWFRREIDTTPDRELFLTVDADELSDFEARLRSEGLDVVVR